MVDFDEWVEARGDALLRFAYVLTGNRADAEDAVQDALSRALPRWDRIRQADDPDAYVRRMVVNAHTSLAHPGQRRDLGVLPLLELVGSDRPEPHLPDRGLATTEAPPPGTVRSRVSRGLTALREELGEDD